MIEETAMPAWKAEQCGQNSLLLMLKLQYGGMFWHKFRPVDRFRDMLLLILLHVTILKKNQSAISDLLDTSLCRRVGIFSQEEIYDKKLGVKSKI